jgi:hypothetical protein
MFYTRPLNPPTLGDFEFRTSLSTLPDRAISWGAGGPSAIVLRLTEQYWEGQGMFERCDRPLK